MDTKLLLEDAKKARSYLTKVIDRLEDPGVSFMDVNERDDVETIRNFIQHSVGNFVIDLLSATDMCNTLNDRQYGNYSKMGSYKFTPVMVGRTFKKLAECDNKICGKSGGTVRLCIVRNREYYNQMSSKQLYDEYVVQKEGLK